MVAGIWAEELGIVDAVQTAHFALFIYEAGCLDNPSCLIQAYKTAMGLIDSWMVYPQHMPFLQLPKSADIHAIFLQYHRDMDCPVPLLHHHNFLMHWNLLPP
uniref:Uncharacterized protein n=1 Tax=Romanomermis culicivorax TaxID=13658 RepID=A0A915J8T6_ROMCU